MMGTNESVRLSEIVVKRNGKWVPLEKILNTLGLGSASASLEDYRRLGLSFSWGTVIINGGGTTWNYKNNVAAEEAGHSLGSAERTRNWHVGHR